MTDAEPGSLIVFCNGIFVNIGLRGSSFGSGSLRTSCPMHESFGENFSVFGENEKNRENSKINELRNQGKDLPITSDIILIVAMRAGV